MPRVSKGAIVVFGGSTLKVTGGRTDVVSATSGLGGSFGFEVVCRGTLGTGSFAGILECGVLSLGGMLVVCLGAIVFCGDSVLNATNSRSSETDGLCIISRLGEVTGFKTRVCSSVGAVLAVVLGLGRGRRVRCTLGANVVVLGALVLRVTGVRAVARTTVAGTSVLRTLGSRSVAATGLVRGVSGVGVV